MIAYDETDTERKWKMNNVVELNVTALAGGDANFFNKAAKERLKTLVEEIEAQEDAKRDIAETITSLFADAKEEGFDPKIMRQIIRLRRKNKAERDGEASILDIYLHALEMI